MHKFTSDDWACIISTFFTVLFYINCVLAIKMGKAGRHEWDTPILVSIGPWYGWTQWVTQWLGSICLAAVKTTFFLFYLQIFKPIKYLRLAIYTGLGFTIVAFTTSLIAQLAITTPAPGTSWFTKFSSKSYIQQSVKLAYPVSSVSLFMDVYIFVLPIVGVAKLKLSRRRKFGVIIVFLTGLSACIASSLSIYYRKLLLDNANDPTWMVIPVTTLTVVELCVGLTCSCMPSSAKLVSHYYPDFSIIDTVLFPNIFSLGSRRTLASSQTSGPYKRQDAQSTESGMELKGGSRPWIKVRDLELGTTSNSQTVVEVDNDKAPKQSKSVDGIHLQQEWGQTWQAV